MKKISFGKNAEQLAKTVIEMMVSYKGSVHFIINDNSTEFIQHKKRSTKLLT